MKSIYKWAIVAYVVLGMWLFESHFSLFGRWSTSTASIASARRIEGPYPHERVEEAHDGYGIKELPVYVSVKNPKKFDHARVDVTWNGNPPVLYAGVVKQSDPWSVETQLLYHEFLETLSWPSLEKDGIMLWQRTAHYASVDEFLKNPPPLASVAAVEAPPIHFPQVIETGGAPRISYTVPLRGSQDIYLYSDGEDINISFLVHDINRHDDPDPVRAVLQDRVGKEYARAELPDDGIEWGSGESYPARKLGLEYHNPLPGVYRVRVSASDDIVFRSIQSNQKKMVFRGTLYLGDEIGYRRATSASPVTVWSNSEHLTLRTPHPSSVQTIRIAGGDHESVRIPLAEANKQYSFDVPREEAGSTLSITSPKRDVILNGDGFFALSREAFFMPDPLPIYRAVDLNARGIDYVIARYKKVQEKKGVYRGEAMLNTYDVTPRTPLQFFIGGALSENAHLVIKKVNIQLTKPGLTLSKISGIIRKLVSYVREGYQQ